jgi:hypothetical protein
MKYSNLFTRYVLILLFIFSTNLFLTAQNEGSIWYFGHNAGLNMSSATPTVLTGGALNTAEGSASMSDAAGNLLFYTDGQQVYNQNHSLMPNGSGLLGHPSSTQSSIIIQKPSSSTEFYIFTVDYVAGANGVTYSKVDMTLSAGLGDVDISEKNVFLAGPSAEKITSVCHGTEDAIWVIAPIKNTNTFHSWKIDNTGVNLTSITSNTGNSIPYAYGWLKGSPSGNKLALAIGNGSATGFVEVYDFDNTTGIVNHTNSLSSTNYRTAYGIEFSPNEQYLYMSMLGSYNGLNANVYQFDMTSLTTLPTIVGSHPTDYDSNHQYPGGALQIAPNGKIYMAGGRNHSGISTIHNPNNAGIACNFALRDVSLGANTSDIGLPSFNQCLFSDLNENCVDITNENTICNPDGSVTYSFDFTYNGTLPADNFIITDMLGNTLFNVGGLSLVNGSTYSTVSFNIPAGTNNFCFRLRLFGEEECCHIEHCIEVPICNPCDSVWVESFPLDDEGDCCHSIDIINNFNGTYFTNITSRIITPGVTFSNPIANGGWAVTGSGNSLNWTPPVSPGFVPYGSSAGVMDFCLDNIIHNSQIPQTVIFDWWAVDAAGELEIVCSDTLYFDCSGCLLVSDDIIDCNDDGTYNYNFTIWNNTNPAHDATDLRIVPLMPGVCLDGNSSMTPVTLPLPSSPLSSGGSDNLSLNISDCGAGLVPGSVVPFRLILQDNGVDLDWCCHVDTLWLTIPECPNGGCKCEDLADDIAQGFSISGSLCTKTFTPIALEDCDSVKWHIDGAIVGNTSGNTPFSYTFNQGDHNICMIVTRYADDGSICEMEYCTSIYLEFSCILNPDGGLGVGTTLPNLKANLVLGLTPNPVIELIFIEINNYKGRHSNNETRVKHIEVFDITGKKMKLNYSQVNTRLASDRMSLNVSSLPLGTYLIRMTLDDGNIATEKFMKVK